MAIRSEKYRLKKRQLYSTKIYNNYKINGMAGSISPSCRFKFFITRPLLSPVNADQVQRLRQAPMIHKSISYLYPCRRTQSPRRADPTKATSTRLLPKTLFSYSSRRAGRETRRYRLTGKTRGELSKSDLREIPPLFQARYFQLK